MDITIDAPDLPKLIRRYERAPQVIDQEFALAVEESTKEAEGEIAERTPVNRATLKGSIASHQEHAPGVARGIVSTSSFYAVPVEVGRRPGKPPPVNAILQWVQDKGLGGRTRIIKSGPSAGQEELVSRAPAQVQKRIAFAIRAKIAKHGTKGKFMFRDGAKAAQPFIRQRFTAATARVKRRLESGS